MADAEVAGLSKTVIGTGTQRSGGNYVKIARGLEGCGSVDQIATQYESALVRCRDLPDAALTALLRFPPEPPSGLQATPTSLDYRAPLENVAGPAVAHLLASSGNRGSEPRSDRRRRWCSAKISMNLFVDFQRRSPGFFIIYAVYGIRTGIPSNAAALIGPVFRVAEVEDLRVSAGEGVASLSWKLPAKATGVEVWRKVGSLPQSREESDLLKVVTMNTALDSGLSNDTTYGYRVVVLFKGPDGRTVASSGVARSAMVARPAAPVIDLSWSRVGLRFEATWTRPPTGTVQIRIARDENIPAIGTVISIDEIDQIGPSVPALAANAARGELNGQQVFLLVPITVNGSSGTVGRPTWVSCIDDVSDLSLEAHREELIVRWKWPANVQECVVCLGTERFPASPDDRTSTNLPIDRRRYESHGGFRHPISPTDESLYVTVFAAIHNGTRWNYSAGCRRELSLGKLRTVKYRIAPKPGRWPLQKSEEHVLILTPNLDTVLPELILLAKPGGRPLSRESGRRILQIAAGETCSPEQPFSSPIPAETGPTKCGVWLFADPSAQDWIELIPEKPEGYWLDLSV